MICVFLLFCSLISNASTVPADYGYVMRYGAMNFAAHNYRDGQYFSEIQVGDTVYYCEKGCTGYTVTELVQAEMAGTDMLIDGELLTEPQVIETYLERPDTLVLFTCVEKDGNGVWGRLFVVAELDSRTDVQQ